MAEKSAPGPVVATVRESFGKGAARKLRVLGKVPVVIYGHGTDPVHLALPSHEMSLLLRKANAVISIDVNGEIQQALVKDVQKDPVRQIIEHIDLIVLRKGEKVVVEVPLHLSGDPFSGTVASLELNTISLEALAISIPEKIVVDVEGAEDGTHIQAKDLVLPAGSVLITDPEAIVVVVAVPRLEEEDAPAPAAE